MKNNLSCLIGTVILWGATASCSSKAPNHDGNETNVVAADTLTADSMVAEAPLPISEQDIQAKKDFLEAFYQVLDTDDYDVEKYVTPKALQILKNEYEREYDCEDGDCLAVWLFSNGYGADVEPLLSRTIKAENENDFLVEMKYKVQEYTYSVVLTVIKDGDAYKIDDIKNQHASYVETDMD